MNRGPIYKIENGEDAPFSRLLHQKLARRDGDGSPPSTHPFCLSCLTELHLSKPLLLVISFPARIDTTFCILLFCLM